MPNCAPETCIILLTSVMPINLIEMKKISNAYMFLKHSIPTYVNDQ